MTSKDSLHFMYDRISSYDKGLYNVTTSLGLYEEQVSGKRSTEEDVDMAGNRYLKKVNKEPLEFEVSFYFQDRFYDEKVRDITRWLLQETYKPLVFSNEPEKIYYAMAVGDYKLIHNGLGQGYLNFTFRCNTYHGYSAFYSSPVVDLTMNPTEGTIVEFVNSGDFETQPIIHLKKVGDGDISFVELSDGGKTMNLSSLVDGEEVTIDCLNKELETNTGFNRYNTFNFNWISLHRGVNRIKVLGNCTLYHLIQNNMY